MYWLKGCPRCHGDLQALEDLEGPYVACIQCGKVLTDAQEQALRRATRVLLARQLGLSTQKVAA
jgi:uncharacterized membrane protein YvbJ